MIVVFFAAGTIRSNRLKNIGELKSVKQFDKTERGTYDFQYAQQEHLLVVRWKDSSVMSIISNFGGVEPVNTVKRYSRESRKHILVSQPNIISSYNKYMGGVDLADSMIASYKCSIQGKKWYWNIFTNSIDQMQCFPFLQRHK